MQHDDFAPPIQIDLSTNGHFFLETIKTQLVGSVLIRIEN